MHSGFLYMVNDLSLSYLENVSDYKFDGSAPQFMCLSTKN